MKTYHDIAGDGGSDVLGQVEARRAAIERALSGVRRLVAVGSGKGGVGKSTVTMALAQAVAGALAGAQAGEGGRRVTILDADLNGPSQARLAGLEGRPWIPGERGLLAPRRPDGIGVLSLGSVLADGAPLGFETVSEGEQQTWRATRELATLAQILAATDWGELDALLLDLPPGAERTVQFAELLAGLGPAVAGRTAFVLVTVPSAVSRGVVARSLSALTEALTGTGAAVLGYVENMSGYLCRGCGKVRPLFPEPTVPLDAPRLASVPFDPEIAALCDRGWPEEEGANALPDALAELADLARELLEADADASSGDPTDRHRPRQREGEAPR